MNKELKCPCGWDYEKDANKELDELYKKDSDCDFDLYDMWFFHEMGCDTLQMLDNIFGGCAHLGVDDDGTCMTCGVQVIPEGIL